MDRNLMANQTNLDANIVGAVTYVNNILKQIVT